MNILGFGKSSQPTITKRQQDNFLKKCREMGLATDAQKIFAALKEAGGSEDSALDSLLQSNT